MENLVLLVQELEEDSFPFDVLFVQECMQCLEGQTFFDNQGHGYFFGVHHWRCAGLIINQRWRDKIQWHSTSSRHPMVAVDFFGETSLLSSWYLPQDGWLFHHYLETLTESAEAIQRQRRLGYDWHDVILGGDFNGSFWRAACSGRSRFLGTRCGR